MKKIFYFAFVLLSGMQGFAQTNESPVKGPAISFTEASHDFGDIVQGAKVEKIFKFQNTGTDPLIISEVITTCGCTATQWNKEPILPGKTGEIQATFNSEGKQGRQNKPITILSNASNSPKTITIIANVLPAAIKQ